MFEKLYLLPTRASKTKRSIARCVRNFPWTFKVIIRHIVCLAIALECVQREFETRCGHVLIRRRIRRVVLQQHQPYYRVDGCRDAQHILRIVVEMSSRRLCVAVCCSVLQCVAVCCSVLQFVAVLQCVAQVGEN